MASEQEMIMSTIEMVFSLRQLQEKSREQRGNPCIKREWYIAFIDSTKAFSLVSTLLKKIGCPPSS